MPTVEIIDDVKWKSYCCFGKILNRKTTFENSAITVEPYCERCGQFPITSKKSIKKMMELCRAFANRKSVFEDLSDRFSKLPKGFNSKFELVPEEGQKVKVYTNRDNIKTAVFESFLGNEIWETDEDFEEDEMVIGWKNIEK